MSFYKAIGRYQFNEQEIEEIGTGKKFTACEKNRLFSQDFCVVERFNYATPHDDGRTKDSLFRFLFMPDGYSLEIIICDYTEGKKVIRNNLDAFLQGAADPKKLLKELHELQGGKV